MHRKKTSAMAALALLFGATTAAVAAPEHPAAAPDNGATTSVTLLTGDKVLVDQTGEVVTVQPAPGRERIPVSTTRERGHTHVVPEDASLLLASGKLDPRLFDITSLIEFGYDDANTSQLPLIIRGDGVMAARSTDSWRALTATSDKIWLDGIRKPVLDRSTVQIGAPAAWQAGFTGKGVKVAVLDTGVDANHPDLKGKQLAERNFTTDPDATDNVGHGTHVGATIASTGGQNTNGRYRGVAPDAELLDGKVCIARGCAESWILDGMNWAAEQGADVVNLSLGGGDTPEVDPLEEAVNTLSARYGTLFVIAAGNSGAKETVASPGSADAALTVGAVDRDEKIAPFSSRGPRIGDGAIKPDVTAPGVGIVAAQAGSTGHIGYSGTSMATPHVAGAAALLKQQRPEWTGSQIKAALVSSAKANADLSAFDQGSGRIDLAKAITQDVTAEPANLHLGFQAYPHTDDKPLTKTVTYVNTSDDAVTFSVALQTSAPAGLLGLGASTVTVPAGGKASVSVVADTRVAPKGGIFTGAVVATAGELVVRTPVSVTSEVESYDVTVKYIDADGKPAWNYSSLISGLDVDKRVYPYDQDGETTLRLPKGEYAGNAYIRTSSTRYDVLPMPQLSVTADATVVFDARAAKPINVKFPAAITGWPGGSVNWVRRYGDGGFGASLLALGGLDGIGVTHLGNALPDDQFGGSISAQAKHAVEAHTFYRFAWRFPGKMPTGFDRAPQLADLARIDNNVGQQVAGKNYYKGMYPSYDGLAGGRSSTLFTIPGGVRPIEYVTTETAWEPLLYQLGPGIFNFEVVLTGAPRSYRPGDRVTERINYAVFGPAMPKDWLSIGRHRDTLYSSVSMLADFNSGSGSSTYTSAKTVLYRDDAQIYQSDRPGYVYTEVPAAAANYRIETEMTRPFELSSSVRAKWTFRSGHTTGVNYTGLPATAVRFLPQLDDANALKAGRLHRVALTAEQTPSADNGAIRTVEVEYSFDDGKTWRRAGVVGKSALIYHPHIDGYASLRAKTADTKGNTSEITIMRAYKVAK